MVRRIGQNSNEKRPGLNRDPALTLGNLMTENGTGIADSAQTPEELVAIPAELAAGKLICLPNKVDETRPLQEQLPSGPEQHPSGPEQRHHPSSHCSPSNHGNGDDGRGNGCGSHRTCWNRGTCHRGSDRGNDRHGNDRGTCRHGNERVRRRTCRCNRCNHGNGDRRWHGFHRPATQYRPLQRKSQSRTQQNDSFKNPPNSTGTVSEKQTPKIAVVLSRLRTGRHSVGELPDSLAGLSSFRNRRTLS